MSDGSDGAKRGISRRAFLRGDFLGPPEIDHESSDDADESSEASPEEGDEPALPPESRGPAVDVEAIVGRAEQIAGVADREDETPHPAYQDRDSSAERGTDDE